MSAWLRKQSTYRRNRVRGINVFVRNRITIVATRGNFLESVKAIFCDPVPLMFIDMAAKDLWGDVLPGVTSRAFVGPLERRE